MKMKKIPYGITNLETIIEENYYYVDKTRFIRDIEDEGRYVIFLRPRRYGKSLFIAMLQYYYDIRFADKYDANVPQIIAFNPSFARSSFLLGAISPIPPTCIATEPRFANPHNAKLAITIAF